jgi:CheY-like chemotaxis protein
MGKNILLLDQKETAWIAFLSEYFEDTLSTLHFFFETPKAATFIDSTPPDMVFLNAAVLSKPVAQKLKVLRQSRPEFRIFHLGPVPKHAESIPIDEIFLEPQYTMQFQKQLTPHLIFPDVIRVLAIDDEPEVGSMLRDYLENRRQPSFEILHTEDGQKGLALLEKESFHVVVLDMKMPAMHGREVYREIKTRGIKTPVIIYFDAIFGDEMVEVQKYGKPAVVEKGSDASTMPEMTALIKKMVYFS